MSESDWLANLEPLPEPLSAPETPAASGWEDLFASAAPAAPEPVQAPEWGRFGDPNPDGVPLHEYAREANRRRSEVLARIAVGEMTWADALRAVSREDQGGSLGSLKLRQVFLALPGFGEGSMRRLLERLRTHSDGSVNTNRTIRLSALMDARSRGSRVTALVSAVHENVIPWEGFPSAPAPQGGGR